MISEPVVCLFPYVTEVLPSRSSPDIHDTCTRATNGNTWCPTKLRLVKWTMDTHTTNGNIECPTKLRLVIGTVDTHATKGNTWCPTKLRLVIDIKAPLQPMETRGVQPSSG